MDELKGAIERVEAEKGRKLTKNERNRLKTKLVKKKEPVQPPAAQTTAVASPKKMEYVSENLDKALSDASSSGVIGDQALEEFKDVFSKFAKPEELIVAETEEADEELAKGKEKKSGFTEEKLGDGDSDSDSNSGNVGDNDSKSKSKSKSKSNSSL